MKRNVFYIALLSLMLTLGAAGAKAQITKGYEVEPMSDEIAAMCQQVIDLQLEDPDQGNKIFQKVLKKIQKNKDQLISVGDFFLDKNIFQVAKMCADQVYKLDPTYIPGLMFAGQVNKARGFATGNETFFGLAGQKYEEVLAQDPNNVAALRQNVTIYKNINPAAAESYLVKIAELSPDDYTISKDLGDIRYKLENYPEAREYYKKYFSVAPENDWDQVSAQNYVVSISSAMDFEDLSQVSRQFHEKWPNDIVFRRMMFLSDVYNGDTEKANESVSYLSDPQYKDDDYTFLDYSVAKTHAMNIDDTPAAIEYMKKAIAKDASRTETVAELAYLYFINGEAENAIENYEKYFATAKEPQAIDYFRAGRAYLTASRKVEGEAQAELVNKGDAAFTKAIELDKEYYSAAFWRARLHMTDTSKPQEEVATRFEQLLEMLGENNDEANESFRDGAYSYLVWYYYTKEDIDSAKKYVKEWEKYNPENETMQQFRDALK